METFVQVPASKSGQTVHVLLDKEGVALVNGRKLSIGSHGYAQVCPPGTGRVVLLHRWLLGLQRGDQRIGDHINGDPLDCRRSNLRIVDASGSSQNVSGRGRSRFRGVFPTKGGRWRAQVKFQGITYRLGVYANEVDAAIAAHLKRSQLMPAYVVRPDLATILPEFGHEPTPPEPVPGRRRAADIAVFYARARSAGRTQSEIAAELGMTRGGLSAALHRSRAGRS